MLTINIAKTELKKAFFGGKPEYKQNITQNKESLDNLDIVLLKIMLANYQPQNIQKSI